MVGIRIGSQILHDLKFNNVKSEKVSRKGLKNQSQREANLRDIPGQSRSPE